MENEDNEYKVFKNGELIYSRLTDTLKATVEDAICKASELTSLRIGDLVAVELTPVSPLTSRQEGEVSFKATYCENELYDMKVIF